MYGIIAGFFGVQSSDNTQKGGNIGTWRGRTTEYTELLEKRGIKIDEPEQTFTNKFGVVQLILKSIESYSILPHYSRNPNEINSAIYSYLQFDNTVTSDTGKLETLLNTLEVLNKMDPDMQDSWTSLWPSALVIGVLSAIVLNKMSMIDNQASSEALKVSAS